MAHHQTNMTQLQQPLLDPSSSSGDDEPIFTEPLERQVTFDDDGQLFDSIVSERLSGPPPNLDPESLSLPTSTENTFNSTVLQVSKVILGSGMLVLPKVYQLLGCGLAIGLLCAVGLMTWFTVHGLVYASEKAGKERQRPARTYASVVRISCGRPAKWGVLAAVFANCLGMCVVFLVIFSDILLGSAPEYSGLIRQVVPQLSPDSWVLDRGLVIAVVVVCILLPLSAQRDLHVLSPLALVGVGSVGLFAVSTMWLTGAAWVQGVLYDIPWKPDWDDLADGSTSSPDATPAASAVSVVLGIAAVVPLLLNADICHQSIFPCISLLHPYSRKSFNRVIAVALTICNVLYTLIALCCVMVFGDKLESNVLNNMSAVHMTPLIGAHAAAGLALLVRLTYFISMLGSFVFTLHPLRHCVMEVLLGSNFPTKKQDKADQLFFPLTLLLLVATYLIAVMVPGIWEVLSMVGSTASTFMGFIFPALVIMYTRRKKKWSHTMIRCTAGLVAAIGLFLFVNGFSVLENGG